MQYLAKDHITNQFGIAFNFGGNWPAMHSHDYWEFVLITDNCTQIINNKSIKLSEGNALIVRPRDKHKFKDSKMPISQFNIKITDDKLLGITESYEKELHDFMRDSAEPIVLSLGNFEYDSVYKCVQSSLLGEDKKRLPLYLRRAIHIMINNYVETHYLRMDAMKHYSITVQLIMEKISMWNNFSQPLGTLLKDFNYSYMQLYRIFKKETGTTLNDYFMYCKMNYASSLLLTSDYSVVYIGQTIGYATQSHFGKAFRDYFGVTPTEYRKNSGACIPKSKSSSSGKRLSD